MSVLNLGMIRTSERHLRRAHLVLAWILHSYVHSHPPNSDSIIIPASISVPLLTVSRELALPPVLTYADTVLYNWKLVGESPSELKTVTSFTGTKDEEHFILVSAYIELAGVEALSLMQKCFDEAFVADSIAIRRISSYLKKLASAIKKLTKLLETMRDGCDPKVFYNEIRPWFRGEDTGKRRWIFLDEEGEELYIGDHRELSGPSNGQSSLIHAFDVFLGVDHTPTRPPGVSTESTTHAHATSSKASGKPVGFLERMQTYMPRHHRAFINHLKVTPRPIRGLVSLNASNGVDGSASSLAKAYDAAVLALKGLRDSHIRIATLYIISQMPRRNETGAQTREEMGHVAKGTGGSDLVPFLKNSRDDTTRTMLNTDSNQRQ